MVGVRVGIVSVPNDAGAHHGGFPQIVPEDGAGIGQVHKGERPTMCFYQRDSSHESVDLATGELRPLRHIANGQVSEDAFDFDAFGAVSGSSEFSKVFRTQPDASHAAINSDMNLGSGS